jgi:AcrR family transcriptional regulator
MARPKAFDEAQALDAAIEMFREHGFDGTSAEMLIRAMGIGRQSLYDTFGDKWRLYLASVRRYVDAEAQAHLDALRSQPRAIDGIRSMVERLVAEAGRACLGVNSVCEFGRGHADLTAIHDAAAGAINTGIVSRLREAGTDGDLAPDISPEQAADFLTASFAGIRIAARGGANPDQLQSLGRLALRALR